MRIRGYKKKLYLLTSSRPRIDRFVLHLCRSVDEVLLLLRKNERNESKKIKKK